MVLIQITILNPVNVFITLPGIENFYPTFLVTSAIETAV